MLLYNMVQFYTVQYDTVCYCNTVCYSRLHTVGLNTVWYSKVWTTCGPFKNSLTVIIHPQKIGLETPYLFVQVQYWLRYSESRCFDNGGYNVHKNGCWKTLTTF